MVCIIFLCYICIRKLKESLTTPLCREVQKLKIMTSKAKKEYLFLQDPEDPNTVYAKSKNSFEKMKLTDTYDRYGQAITHYDAGNSIILNTQKAVDLANKKSDEIEYKLGDYVSADEDLYDFLLEKLEENEYELQAEECLACNYFDGSNHQTVIVKCDSQEPYFNIVDDEIFAVIIEKMKFVEEVNAGAKYEYYDEENDDYYEIYISYYQSDWSDYRIIKNPITY